MKTFRTYSVYFPYGKPIEYAKIYTEDELRKLFLTTYFDRYRDVFRHPFKLYDLAEALKWVKTSKPGDKMHFQDGNIYHEFPKEGSDGS